MVSVNSISFKARFADSKKYQNACEGAYQRFEEHKIAQGESYLASSDFPDHKLKLLKDGILNVSTKKTHKFPWQFAEQMTPTENLLSFYKIIKESGNSFVKNLFS